jgi:RNase P/RNase MRP subunit POP5
MTGTKNNSKPVSTKSSVAKSSKQNTKQISKQKVLLPTLKEQQRYLVYKIITKNSSTSFKDFGNIHNNILLQCNTLMGIFDGGKAGLMGAKYNSEKLTGIIRVNNKYVDKLKVCLGLIKNINTQDITIDCIYVSGMLNKAAEKMDI